MSEKQMLYKVCLDEQGEYVDAQGRRCNLLVCNEVVFLEEEILDAEGKVAQTYVPTPQERGYYSYPSLEAALAGLDLQKADGGGV